MRHPDAAIGCGRKTGGKGRLEDEPGGAACFAIIMPLGRCNTQRVMPRSDKPHASLARAALSLLPKSLPATGPRSWAWLLPCEGHGQITCWLVSALRME